MNKMFIVEECGLLLSLHEVNILQFVPTTNLVTASSVKGAGSLVSPQFSTFSKMTSRPAFFADGPPSPRHTI